MGAPQELGWDELPPEERRNVLMGSAANWVYRMNAVQRAGELVGQDAFLTVHYEKLGGDTPAELVRIASWLGAEGDDGWATGVASRHAFERIPVEQRGKGKFHRAATPGLWRQNMNDDEQRLLGEVMGEKKLRELGYDAD